jgi:hypothetical protein
MNRFSLALLLITGIATAWSWAWPLPEIDTAAIPPSKKGGTNSTSFSEPDLRQLEEARFFLDTESLVFGAPPIVRAPITKSPQAEPKATPDPAPKTAEAPNAIEAKQEKAAPSRPTLAWRLAGVMEGSGGSRALFVSGTDARTLRYGQSLDGWKIVSISQTGVGLTNQGFSRTLVLFDKDNVPEAAYPRDANDSGQDPGTTTQPSAPQSMQDFGPVRRDDAWTTSGNTDANPTSSEQGGPVNLKRRTERSPTNSDNRATEAAAPAN